MARVARRGHHVLYVDPALVTRPRTRAVLAEAQPQLHVLVPSTASSPEAAPAGTSADGQRLLRHAARRIGLRGPVGLSFVHDGERLFGASWMTARIGGPSADWMEHRSGADQWDVAADALIRRLQIAEDRAIERRADHTGPAAGPPHRRLARRVASLSWKAHAAFAGSLAAGWIYYLARLGWRTLARRQWRPIDRILIARPRCHLGDLIVLLPMLEALRRRFPHAHIALATQPGMPAARLLDSTGLVDDIRVFDHLEPLTASPTGSQGIARLAGAARLFAEGYDLVMSGSIYFLQREPFFGGTPRRVGFDEGDALQALNSLAIPFDPSRHEADNNLRLAQLVGATVPPQARAPRLRVDTQTSGLFARLCETLQVPPGASILTVHPGSKMPTRRWPADRFGRLVSTLLEERPDLHVVFSGVDGEAALIDGILAMMPDAVRPRAVSAAGLTDLAALMALLTHSVALLCNDTGSMHVARALGTPLVALMGPENHLRWGPYPQGAAPAIVLRHEVPCAPCRRQDCEALYCLRSLEVEQVLGTLRVLLDGSTRETAAQVQWQRHSWRQLAACGFELPALTVVVFSDAVRRGAAQMSVPAGADDIVRSLQQQHYPRWTVAFASRQSPQDALRHALDLTAAEFVLPLMAHPCWAPGRLDDDVAALVQDPALMTAAGGRPGPALPSPLEDLAPLHDVMLRSDALLERLPHTAKEKGTPAGESSLREAASLAS